MKILLVTMSDILPVAFNKVLNPDLEYVAIIVDEPENATKFLENIGLPQILTFPFWDIKECIENFSFDYCLFLSDKRTAWSSLKEQFRRYGLPKEKIIDVFSVNTNFGFYMSRAMRYYQIHADEFDTFATGLCYTEIGLDCSQLKKHTIMNFGRGSQDLYYDYKFAKYAVSMGRRIKNALIGVAPYSFHYDISQAYAESRYIFQYVNAFRDIHNYRVPLEDYLALFSKEYLSFQMDLDNFNVYDVYDRKKDADFDMTIYQRLNLRSRVDSWKDKYFAQTRDANIKIFDDYLTLCEENNIRPIIFTMPVTECYKIHFNKKILDEFYYIIREAIKKHPRAVFFDSWQTEENFDEYFINADHINLKGAKKFTSILNDFIEELEEI